MSEKYEYECGCNVFYLSPYTKTRGRMCEKHHMLWEQMQDLRKLSEPPTNDEMKKAFKGNCGWCNHPFSDHDFFVEYKDEIFHCYPIYDGHICEPKKEEERIKKFEKHGIIIPYGEIPIERINVKRIVLENDSKERR